MADDGLRPMALMVGAVLLLVVGLLAWAAIGYPLPSAITGSSDAAPQATTAGAAGTTGPAVPAVATTAASTPVAQQLAPRATTDRFDGARAFALLREQVRAYGWRPAGSASLRRLAVRLRALLPNGRLEPVPGHKGLRNVVGSLPGRGKPIVIGAHYDVEARPVGFVGANDGAAGTAAVVELARVLGRAPRARGDRAVRFVLFDGEEEPAGCVDFIECALRGSKAYVDAHGDQTRSLVLLDYIAEKHGLSFPREGGSDRALWAKLRAAATDVGVGSLFTDATGPLLLDDHTPFTDEGIPAIDVIDFEYPPADTLQDTIDKVSQRSLDAVGEAAYRLATVLRRER